MVFICTAAAAIGRFVVVADVVAVDCFIFTWALPLASISPLQANTIAIIVVIHAVITSTRHVVAASIVITATITVKKSAKVGILVSTVC